MGRIAGWAALVVLSAVAGAICPGWGWVGECQAQTSGALRGVVIDEAGRPLAGVSVTVSGAGGAVAGQGAVTDASGIFQVVSLPPAVDYVVVVRYPGYATMAVSEVEVRAGVAATLRLTLQKETSLVQRVEVKAEPQVVRLEETTTQTRFSAEFIEALPLLGRNYQDLLSLAPGVSDTDGDGNPNIHGARDTDVVTLVDGVSTTDPLTGKVGAQLNIESIQEIEVKTSGASAEFGRAQGGFANILTKSGGNELTGTFKIYWRGSALDGDGAGIDDPTLHGGVGERGLRDLKFNDFLPFLSISGPIVKDRAWYYLANEYVQTEEPVNALSAAFVTSVKELREFLKLTWQAGANHRLALSVNYDPQQYLNQGLNSLTREESGFTTRQGGPVVTLKVTSVLSPLVALETSLSSFDERPARVPTLEPDTNHDGVMYIDRNGNGFHEATERDPGEDYDADGRFDVFEKDNNGNGRVDPGEDLDGDGRLTQPARGPLGGGCEGTLREDQDCDGRIDFVDEDTNHNGRLDLGEDIDGDGRLDPGTEDRNGNQTLDDTPVPKSLYPYGELTPRPPDRDYTIDQRTRIVSGPFYQDFADQRRRFTLRQDLTTHVPDYWGSHDLKFGFVYERENFERRTEARDVLAPFVPASPREGPGTVRAILPAESDFRNSATEVSGALYAQDTYRPFPNLSLGAGVRFDRELVESFGYTPFDPAKERAIYDRISDLAGAERGKNDFLEGDNDGLQNLGILSDPMFSASGDPNGVAAFLVTPLYNAAIGHLTRHHLDSTFSSQRLASIFPDVIKNGLVDPVALLAHGVVPQRREPFALTNNNLAPRLSIAWDPMSNGRTKVFATWGRYYDKLFLNTVVGEEGPDTLDRYYALDPDGITGAGTPDHQIGSLFSSSPPSTTQVDRGLETPFSDEFTFGFERELAPEVAVSVTYVNRRFRRQIQDVDVNHALRLDPTTHQPRDDFGLLNLDPANPGSNGLGPRSDGRPDLYIRNFFFNEVLRIGNFNEARYHAIELEVLRRLSRRWQLQASYTYSRAVGSAEDFQSRLGNDPSTVALEFGYLDFDQRHVVKVNTMTYLPHDWQVGFSATWSSGLPYSVISRFFSLDNVGYQQFRTLYGFTDAGPSGPEFHPLRRNARRNPSTYDLNLHARRAFVWGHTSGSVFLEVFNLLNADDLRIFSYDPTRSDRLTQADLNTQALQLDAQRRFGRRFQVGLQFQF
jgi:outer membrane receptor protein involved in Fe transport